MSWKQVATGGVINLVNLPNYENELAEGSTNWLRLNLRLPVSQGVADDLENLLEEAGVEGVKVTTNSPVLNIYFRKGFPWLAVIAAIILASLVVAALVISWRLFTDIPELIPVALLFGVAAVALVGIILIRKWK